MISTTQRVFSTPTPSAISPGYGVRKVDKPKEEQPKERPDSVLGGIWHDVKDKGFWNFFRDLKPDDVVSYTTKGKSTAQAEAEAEAKERAKFQEQREYDEKLAEAERERLEKLRMEQREYEAQREDSAIQRLVRDAMAAGIPPVHALGGGGSVAHASPQGVTTQSKDMLTPEEENNLGDMVKSLLPMLLLIVTRGRIKAPAVASATGSYLSPPVSKFY